MHPSQFCSPSWKNCYGSKEAILQYEVTRRWLHGRFGCKTYVGNRVQLIKALQILEIMAKLQRETDVANVLSQMSQFVHQPSDKGPVLSKEDLEHTYAQNLTTNLTKPDKRKAIEVTKKGKEKATVESSSA